ncbi:hypothetical protein HDU76_000632 [Blyttiomyces sp. JEL0837]|nr:hypothetical protein HDU76_000632 [Blyttiomyces sp. JEL0837]
MSTILESKHRTNITIASFLPFAIGDFYPAISLEDLIMEMAINEVNEDPNILPDTSVNLVRYNSWDPDYSADWPYVNSGGFAMKNAMDVAQSGVIAAVGEYFSKSTIFSAEVFSVYKIPFCAVAASSAKLSNKHQYPYVIRMLPSVTLIMKGHLRMLQSWNVKRVALVVGYDILSRDAAKLVEKYFTEGGVTIITRIDLTNIMVKDHDYKLSYSTLIQVDARNYSLISPKHIWMGTNEPKVSWTDTIDVYGPEVIDLSIGFVAYNYDFEPYSDPPQVQFYAAFDKFRSTNGSVIYVPLNYETETCCLCTKVFRAESLHSGNAIKQVCDASAITFSLCKYSM